MLHSRKAVGSAVSLLWLHKKRKGFCKTGAAFQVRLLHPGSQARESLMGRLEAGHLPLHRGRPSARWVWSR